MDADSLPLVPRDRTVLPDSCNGHAPTPLMFHTAFAPHETCQCTRARMRSMHLQVGSRTIEAALRRSGSSAPSERPVKNTAPNFQSGGAAGRNARSCGLGVSRAAAIDDVAYQDPRTAPSRVPDGCSLSDAIWGPPAPLGRRERGGWKRGGRRARPSRDLRDGTRSRIERRHR